MEGNFRYWMKPLVAVAATLACGAAYAQDNGIFIGAAVSDVSSDFDLGIASPAYRIDDDSSGFKLIGGIRPLDPIGLEVNYVDLGEVDLTLTAAWAPAAGGPGPPPAPRPAQARPGGAGGA